mmetsp:Transcript_26543/g.63444  ORF Transcript_26543/g.63444 Transcript_26543/m.63444 type:complete len:243 (-) Transcript_26543:17-745(-)
MDDLHDLPGRIRRRGEEHAGACLADEGHRGRRSGAHGRPRQHPPPRRRGFGDNPFAGVPDGELWGAAGGVADPVDRQGRRGRPDQGGAQGFLGDEQDLGVDEGDPRRRAVCADCLHALPLPGDHREADARRTSRGGRASHRLTQRVGPRRPEQQGGHDQGPLPRGGQRLSPRPGRADPQDEPRAGVPDGLHGWRPAALGGGGASAPHAQRRPRPPPRLRVILPGTRRAWRHARTCHTGVPRS